MASQYPRISFNNDYRSNEENRHVTFLHRPHDGYIGAIHIYISTIHDNPCRCDNVVKAPQQSILRQVALVYRHPLSWIYDGSSTSG
eukprot:scaffold150544_cov20-Prasinocladus_malaysianus.AAC.1